MTLPPGNRLIDALPEHEAGPLFARARVVTLARAQVSTEHDTVMRHVDFPLTALLSVIGAAQDGTTCDLADVGTEAFVEIDAALRDDVAKRSAICLLEGDVVRVPLADFQRALNEAPEFGRRVFRCVRARVFTTEQAVLCNLRHTVVQRLARWLLMAHARVERTSFPLTHDFLASMLGTRRASVTEALATLVAADAIEHHRGSIAITDAAVLATRACECFAVCRDALAESLA